MTNEIGHSYEVTEIICNYILKREIHCQWQKLPWAHAEVPDNDISNWKERVSNIFSLKSIQKIQRCIQLNWNWFSGMGYINVYIREYQHPPQSDTESEKRQICLQDLNKTKIGVRFKGTQYSANVLPQTFRLDTCVCTHKVVSWHLLLTFTATEALS